MMKRMLVATTAVILLLGASLAGAQDIDSSKVVILPRQAGVPVVFVGDPLFFDFCMLPGDTGVILCSAKYVNRYRVFLVEWDTPVPCGAVVETCDTVGSNATWVPASAISVIRPCTAVAALEQVTDVTKVSDIYQSLINFLTP